MPKPLCSWGAFSAALLVLAAARPAAARDQAAPPAPAAPAVAAAPADAAIDPNSLQLFSVDLGGLTLTEGLAAYGDAADPLVPFGEFTRLLELDVDVRPAERRIEGALGQSRRALLVDLAAHVARVGAETIPFQDGDIVASPTDIYVRSSLLAKLLPLKIAIDQNQLTMSLTATEQLPVQARLERLARRADAGGTNTVDEPALIVSAPYRAFSPPSFDVVLGAGAQSTAPHLPFRYDIRAAGDLMYADLQAYLSSDETGKPTSARFNLDRRSVDGDLFGPLHGRDLSLGDVFTPGLPLGVASASGRGITFSTAPLDQTNVFNRIDVRGELPPGYDVELYVNDVLRGSTNQATNGLYEFLNVPLSPGLNVVRTVTYGPRGERKEVTQVINVGAGLLRPGESTFQIGLVDQNQPLLDLGGQTHPGATTARTSAAQGLRAVAGVNYGLSRFLTVSAGAAALPDPHGGGRGVFTAGARTSLFGLATQLDLGADSRGGSAASVGVAGRFGGVSAVLRQAEYRGGFEDENNLGGDAALQLQGRTELTLDSNLKIRGRILPVALRTVRDAYADGSYDIASTARVSLSFSGLLLSSGVAYQRNAYRPARPVDSLTGYLTASTFAAYAWQLRADLDYDLAPRPRARLLSLSADHKISQDWGIHFAVGQPLDKLSSTDLVVSGVYTSRYGDLALTGEYDNGTHNWRVGAQWNFGLGYDPLMRGYQLTRTGPGSGGSMVLDAFIDKNGNGVRDPGEPAVPDVAVQGGLQNQNVTGANGSVFVTGLGISPTARVNVDMQKVDITSVKAPPSTIQISPRPGDVVHVDYPLRPTGDVMIKVDLVRDDGKHVGLSAVRLQLVPEKGEPIEQTTEFDGSAMFNGVPMGVYRLQLEPGQAKQLRMHLVEAASVQIKGDGGFVPDVDVSVKFDPAPDQPASAPSSSS